MTTSTDPRLEMKLARDVHGEAARIEEAKNGVLIEYGNEDFWLLNDFADVDRNILSVDFDNTIEIEGELFVELRVYA